MGSYSWNGGSGGWGTIANWTGGIPNSSTADATIAAAGTYTVTLESAKTYTVDSATLNDSTAILDIAGTLDLAGTLALLNLASGTLEVAGLVSGGTVNLNSGNTLIAAGGTINATQLVQGGAGYINLNGSSLTLGGTSTLQGYEIGTGNLIIAGQDTLTDNVYFEAGVTLVDTGTISLQSSANFGSGGAAFLSIASGGVFDATVVNAALNDNGTFSINNAGTFEVTETAASYLNVYANFNNASTGTIYLAAGDDVSLVQGQDTLAGSIIGAGDLFIGQGSTASLQASLVLTAGVVTVSDGNTEVILESSRAIAGTFNEINGAYFDLNGHNLTLTNNGTLNGYIGGGGTIIAGGTFISNFYLGAGSEELVTGTAIDANGGSRLDYDNGTAASILSIASTGTYDITQINGQIDYNGTGGTIINSGLFENVQQTPTFTSNGNDDSYFNVYANFTNASTGTILLGTADDISLIYGTNDLAGTITGAGDLYLGTTTTLEAGLVLNNARYLTFNGGGTEIYLKSNRLFAQQYVIDQNGATLQLDGFSATISGGGTLSAYVAGPGTLDITGTVYTSGDLSSGVTEVVSGTEIQNGTVYLDNDYGTAATVLSITTGGTYDITVDNPIYNGYNNGSGSATIINAGLFEKTGLTTYTNIYANFTNASTGTIFIGAELDISLIAGTTNDLAGTITGPGDFYLGQGSTTTLEASAVVSNLAYFTVSDGGTQLILAGNRSFAAGTTFTDQNSGDVNIGATTLTLAGKSSLYNSYLTGSGGELVISGSADINGFNVIGTATVLDQGFITQDGFDELGTTNSAQVTLSIASTGTYDIINDSIINPQNTLPIINAGLFEKTAGIGVSDVYSVFTNSSTGTLNAADGTIRLDSGGVLGGKVIGAGTLDLNGGTFALASAAVSVANLFVTSGALSLQGNFAPTHEFELAGNATLNLAGFTVSLNNSGDYLGSSYITGPGTLSEAGRADVSGLELSGGAVLLDLGTITQDSAFFISAGGADVATLSIASTGIYDILNDSYIYSSASAGAAVNNAGLFEKTADNGPTNIYTTFNNQTGGTLAANTGYIQLLGGGALSGTLAGAGTLYLNQYYTPQTYILAAAAVVTVATLNVNGATLELAGTRSLTDTFIQSGGYVSLNGFNLTLSASDNLDNASLTGPGTLDVTGSTELSNYSIIGGATLLDAKTLAMDGNMFLGNAANDSATLSIAAGGVLNIENDSYIYATGTTSIINAGLLEKTGNNGTTYIEPAVSNTGTINALRGIIELGGGGTLGGTLEGAGEFQLNTGVYTLQSTAVVSVATFDNYNATLDLLSSRTLSGTYIETNNANVNLSSNTLTLTGNDFLQGYATGPGVVDVTGTTDLNNFNLTGGAVLLDAGTLTQDGYLQIGESAADSATLSIVAGGTFDLLNDSYVYESGTVAVQNAGLFEKTGSGTGKSYVQGALTNSGTIAVTTGILEEQSLTNNGVVTINNGTDQTDGNVAAGAGKTGRFALTGNATLNAVGGLAASQTVALSGTNDTVDIGNGSSILGAITGFGATDTIDLQNTVVNGFIYGGGVLTLTENGTVVTSIIVGTVAGAGALSLVQDSAGNGTDIVFNRNNTQPAGTITTDVFSFPTNMSVADFNTASDWSTGNVPNNYNVAVDHAGGSVTDAGINTIYSIDFNNGNLTFTQTAGTLTLIDGGHFDGSLLQQSAGASIIDEAGTLSTYIQGTIAGTLGGAGEIDVGGNLGNGYQDVTIAASAVLSVATLGIQRALLEGNQTYGGVFVGIDGGNTDLNGYTLTLNGPSFLAPTYAYAVNGPGELILAGNATTAILNVGGSATIDVTGTLSDDQNLGLGTGGGSDTSTMTIATTGTYDMLGSTNIYGDSYDTPTVAVLGLLEKTGDNGIGNIQYVTITESSTGILDAARGTLQLLYDSGTLAGTLEGAGTIDIYNSTMTLGASAVLSVATLALTGSTVFLSANETYGGVFDLVSGGTLELGGNNLTLTGSSALDGVYVSGDGTVGSGGTLKVAAPADLNGLNIQQGAELLIASSVTADGGINIANGGANNAGALVIATGATYNIINDSNIGANGTATATNNGLLEKTGGTGISYVEMAFTNSSTGTLNVATGTIDLQSGGTLAGTIDGAGALELQNDNGTFTLAAGAVLTVGTLNDNEILLLASSRAYAGDLIQTNNLDLNGFNLSLTGAASLDSSVQGGGTLTVAGKADASGLYLYQGAVLVVTGTLTQDGGFTMSNTASDSTVLSIASGGVFDLLTDNSIGNNGTAAIINAGTFEKTADYGISYIYPTFTNASTGVIDPVQGFLYFENGGSFAGTLAGGTDGTIADGGIFFNGGTVSLAASAVVTVAELGLNNATLSLGGNLSYAGFFDGIGGTVDLNGHNLTLHSSFLEFELAGPGTLDVTGNSTFGLGETSGAVVVDQGSMVFQGLQLGYSATDTAELSIASGATFNLINDANLNGQGTVSIVNAGLFEKTADNGTNEVQVAFTNQSTGIINVVQGTIGFAGGAVLGGTLTGAGEILLNGNDLLTSTVVNVATLDVAAFPTLGANLTYGGDFILNYADTLTLNSHALLLTGTAALIGGFDGPGSVTVSGSAYVQTADLYGGATLVDTGFINQIDQLRFSLNDNSSDTLAIAASGVYDIQTDTNFQNYASSAAEVVTNAGLLEKTGDTGFSELQVTLSNTGTVLDSSGTLQIDNVTNLALGTLTGGTWESEAGLLGPTLSLVGGIIGVDAAAVTLSGAGSELIAGGTLLEQSLTSVTSAGVLAVLGGGGYASSNAVNDAGKIVLAGGTFAAPSLNIASGGTFSGYGTLNGPVTDNGLISVTGSTLTVASAVSGTGSLLIGAGDELVLGAGAAAGNAITFGGSLSVLGLKAPGNVLGTLVSLSPSDTIDLIGSLASSATIIGSELFVTLSAGGTLAYALAAANPLDRAAVVSDGHGGTDITIFRDATASSVTPATVNFGQRHAGSALVETYTVTNSAVVDPYSEKLDGQMGAHTGSVSDSGSFTGLAPGATNKTSLTATLASSTAGVVSGTSVVNLETDGSTVPGDGNGTMALPSQTVSLSGTIFNYATPSGVSPNPVAFGERHVGAVDTQTLTLANHAAAGPYSENLDASFSGTSSDLTTTGSVSELAAGATSTALNVTLNSATAGSFIGVSTIALTSDGSTIDTLGTTALPSQTVTVTGEFFNLATASIVAPVNFGIVHVGQTAVSQVVVLNNTAAPGAYSENLDGSFSGTSASIATSGTVSELAAGSGSGSALNIGLQTGKSGIISGFTTLNLTSDGTGIDTLGTTALAPETIAVTGTVDAYAAVGVSLISGPGKLSGGAGGVFTLNLGSVAMGGAAPAESIGIENTAKGQADLLKGTLALSGTTSAFTNNSPISFTGVAAGSQSTGHTISLHTGAVGTFTETIVLSPTGYNASGYAGTLAPDTLVVTGTVTAAAAVSPIGASPTVMSFATPASTAGILATPGAPVTGQAAGLGGAEALAGTGASPWGLFADIPDTSSTTYLAHGLATASVAGAVTSFGLTGSDLHKPLSAPVAWAGATLTS